LHHDSRVLRFKDHIKKDHIKLLDETKQAISSARRWGDESV
jgi:hypothetical protein